MTVGFVMTRHVHSRETNELWLECYRKIRKYYPVCQIMIVDDNSNYQWVRIPEDIVLTNCFIVQSEYVGRGELLSYYYYHKYHPFEKAIVLHDSTFLNQPITEDILTVESIGFLWTFKHYYDNVEEEAELIRKLNNTDELLKFHKNPEKWTGCFGVQSILTFSFLNRLVEKYNLFCLLDVVCSRNERYHIERVFAVLCWYEQPMLSVLYGDIHQYYVGWGYTYDQYVEDSKSGKNKHLPFVKVWVGR